MADTKRITIAPRVATQLTVDFAGKEYLIEAPKLALGIVMAQKVQLAGENVDELVDELKSWVLTTFGEKHGEKVWARVMDPKDPTVDIMQVNELIEALVEFETPNPTTSPSD